MQSEFTSMASDFDETPLHNKVYDDINEDEELARFCDAAAAADEAGEYRSRDDELTEAANECWGRLHWAARQRALGVVAEACEAVITDGDQWADEGHWDQETMDDAKHEAREWLRMHSNEAERTGVLGVLS